MHLELQEVKSHWAARGFSCDIFEDDPGRRWEDYVHNVDELFMVIEGKMELEMNGQVYHPRKAEEVLIPAHVRHSVRNIGKTPARWYFGYKRD